MLWVVCNAALAEEVKVQPWIMIELLYKPRQSNFSIYVHIYDPVEVQEVQKEGEEE